MGEDATFEAWCAAGPTSGWEIRGGFRIEARKGNSDSFARARYVDPIIDHNRAVLSFFTLAILSGIAAYISRASKKESDLSWPMSAWKGSPNLSWA